MNTLTVKEVIQKLNQNLEIQNKCHSHLSMPEVVEIVTQQLGDGMTITYKRKNIYLSTEPQIILKVIYGKERGIMRPLHIVCDDPEHLKLSLQDIKKIRYDLNKKRQKIRQEKEQAFKTALQDHHMSIQQWEDMLALYQVSSQQFLTSLN